MWPRFKRHDLGMIVHYLGTMVLLLGAIMLIPLIVSVCMGELDITGNYFIGSGAAILIGSAFRMCRISPGSLERHQAIAVTSLVWVVGAFIAAIPLWLSGHYASPIDALFEGVSGLTSTGLTTVQDIDHLSTADNMWRFTMQFLGGQGVVVIALSLGLFSKVGSSFYTSEGRGEFVMPNIKKTAQFIWQFSLIIVFLGTLILFGILLFSGFEPVRSFFHGLWITIGAYDTAGFAPQSLSIMYYQSIALEFIVMLLMLTGAVNFALYARIWKGGFRSTLKEFTSDLEIRTLAAWITFILLAFIAAMLTGNFITDFSALMRRGLFTIVSVTSNTGFQVLSTYQITSLLTSGAFFVLTLAIVIGGSSGSTAGGIKAMRIGLIAKATVARIKDVLTPSSVKNTTSYNHLGRHLLSGDLTGAAMTITIMYIVTYVVGTIAGIVAGYDPISSMMESVSATSNAGHSSGIISPDTPPFLKIIYMLQMWFGRLEFIAFLAVIFCFVASLRPMGRAKK